MRSVNDNAPASPSLDSKGDEGADKGEPTMAGNANSGRRPAPRNSLGDARINLHVQKDRLVELSDQLRAMDAFWDTFFHECRRALAEANVCRRSAVKSIHEAQAQIVAERDELVEVGPYPAGLAV